MLRVIIVAHSIIICCGHEEIHQGNNINIAKQTKKKQLIKIVPTEHTWSHPSIQTPGATWPWKMPTSLWAIGSCSLKNSACWYTKCTKDKKSYRNTKQLIPVFARKMMRRPPSESGRYVSWRWCLISITAMKVLPSPVFSLTITLFCSARLAISVWYGLAVSLTGFLFKSIFSWL